MRFISILAVLLGMAGCLSANRSARTNASPTMQMITEHIRIDDAAIDKGSQWTVIEPVWWTVNIYDGEAAYEESLAPFSKEQRYLLAINWYMAEVDNGGHDQFYYNSTGIVWKDALAGFRAVGVADAARIVEESAGRLGGDPSLDREARWQQLDAYQPRFDDLDGRLYDLEGQVDLDAVLYEYILQHRGSFYFDGEITRPGYFSATPQE